MHKYNILKHIVVKDQNRLNMQKITHLSATNAILLIHGLKYNYFVLNQ